MGTLAARRVIGAFALIRIAIGSAAMASPNRFSDRADRPNHLLMIRSFAGREMALGVGGCLALRGSAPVSTLSMWAGLGAMTDAADLIAAIANLRRGDRSARAAALLAAIGLVSEGSALAFLRGQTDAPGRGASAGNTE